jgi:hypothetical protein
VGLETTGVCLGTGGPSFCVGLSLETSTGGSLLLESAVELSAVVFTVDSVAVFESVTTSADGDGDCSAATAGEGLGSATVAAA